MSATVSRGYNAVLNVGTDIFGFTISWRNMLALLLIFLTLSISPSCSSKDNAAGNEPNGPAKKAVILPASALPLSAVLKAVESANYSPIVEVEFEKDHWEVKAFSDGKLLQFKVDLFTGAILPSPPPRLEKPLSAVVKSLEDQGYGPILEIERGSEGGEAGAAWEVAGYKGSSEVTLSVESASGKITLK